MGRDALGALVRVESGGHTFAAPVLPSASYLSSNDPRAHFGLGSNASIERIVILWADGARDSHHVL